MWLSGDGRGFPRSGESTAGGNCARRRSYTGRMSVFAKGPKQEEEPGGGSGLGMDLELRACPQCRRELHPWESTCPVDGSPAVPRTSLRTEHLPPPPAHLLADEDDETSR